jgi:hypothetical protein
MTIEYEDLDPAIAAELVIRAKQTHGAPQVAYGLPPTPANYGIPPPSYGYPPPQPQQAPPQYPTHPPQPPSNISNLLGSLSAANQPPNMLHQQQPPQQTGMTPDLARLLGQINHQSPQPQRPPPQQLQHQPPPPNYGPPPPSAQSYGQQYSQPPPPPQPAPVQQQQHQAPPPQDIQQILAGLNAYKPPS